MDNSDETLPSTRNPPWLPPAYRVQFLSMAFKNYQKIGIKLSFQSGFPSFLPMSVCCPQSGSRRLSYLLLYHLCASVHAAGASWDAFYSLCTYKCQSL